jgi:hypothetical protein
MGKEVARPRQRWEIAMRILSTIALLLFMAAGITACASKTTATSQQQTQTQHEGGGMGGGMGGGY